MLAALPAASQKVSVKDLTPRFRAWLEEEVGYIISPKEKAVFLQLGNDREREMFITAFWKARDDDPNTPENKFKDEHYRRIEYANKNFGRGLKAGGWRSDMGRIYITLGEPKTIERYENESNVYPMIVWFYSGLMGSGMPSTFNVVFFKKDSAGDYILYSPVRDGPQKLMPFYNGDMTNYLQAWGELRQIAPQLAELSMSLIPGDYVLGMNPTPASDVLIFSKIPKMGYDSVKDAYAEKLLRYKDIVEVEYTANYIESDALVQITRDSAGRAFVHFLIEPARLSIERMEGIYRTVFDVNGIVSDAGGKTIYQFDRRVPIELDAEQFSKINQRQVSYQDVFPLIDGDYKISLLWKNTVSKEFSSVEAELKIPPAGSLTLSAPILAYRVVRNPAFAGQIKPFTVGETQIVASPRNDFTVQDTLTLFCELGGLTEELKARGSLAITLVRNGQVAAATTKSLAGAPDPMRVLEEFPLASLPPDYYTANVALLDAAKAEVLSSHASFYITLNTSLPRSWIVYSPLPGPGDPSFVNIRGKQYLQSGDLAKARPLLEEAQRRSPESAPFALDLCRALFELKDYDGVSRVATPFYRDKKNYEFAQYLGESAQALGKYGEAMQYYKDYLTYFGTNLNVLNAIGDCYVQLGSYAEAVSVWTKSLELNASQPELKKKLADVREKIKLGLFTSRGGPQMRGPRGEAVLFSTANPENEADGAGSVRPEGKNADLGSLCLTEKTGVFMNSPGKET
ncbi:MAG: GWxTD domain-containing protein [Candidatus Aminicenantes bacterium]|nr:MAG: GWxTD domain-containing protein [Candidatus Aminicenantes bacterium]